MSATGKTKQNCCLEVIRSQQELVQMYSHDQRDPDLFDRLIDDCSFEIYIKTGAPPKKKGIKGCRCSKSGCLKMYCQCFAAGKSCGLDCGCVSCCNQSESIQTQSQSQTSLKNQALHKKTLLSNTSKPVRGCNCRRSGCEKRYCQCFSNGLKCNQLCHCLGCNNCQKTSTFSILQDTNELL